VEIINPAIMMTTSTINEIIIIFFFMALLSLSLIYRFCPVIIRNSEALFSPAAINAGEE
jgi:hypothetical protein